MQFPKRYFPSIQTLLAFEAVSRLGSFSAAANELGLSQSAVSKQIKHLEQQLDTVLLTREHHQVGLTPAGTRYSPEVREALTQIAHASLTVSTNPHAGSLRLGILPTFGTRWLAPRLPQFLDNYPDININLVTKLRPFDFRAERLDAAIYVGEGNWPGVQSQFLMQEVLIPACAPSFLEKHQFNCAADFQSAELLHLATRPNAWSQWMQSQAGLNANPDGMIFDQFSTAAQAAIAGLGVVLLPPFLIKRELEENALVPALPSSVLSGYSYYLVWPDYRDEFQPLCAFRQWIQDSVSDFVNQTPNSSVSSTTS